MPEKKGKEVMEVDPSLQEMATPPRKEFGKRNNSVVDTCLRRSNKIKQVSGGFKKDTSSDRKCLACTPNPPTLSTQVIRKLGTKLYQLEEEELTDEVLLAKREQASPMGEKEDRPKPEEKEPWRKSRQEEEG